MNIRQTLTVIAVLLLSFLLHLHNYTHYPQRGASSDEYTYSFMGISLITKGVPSSWSNFAAYAQTKHYDLIIDHLYFWIVEPYFDHPPLNGLLVGSWALLNGENTFEKIQLSTIRMVPIALSVVTTYLIFLLGNTLLGFQTGVWASLIYATSTIMVVNSRVVFAENLLTPLFLFALYIYSRIKKPMKIKNALTLGLLSGLAIWTKEAGITIYFTILFLFLIDRQKIKPILVTTGMTALGILLYISYGMHYNGKLFWEILSLQSTRLIGPDTLHLLLTKPIIVNKVFFDGWYLLGFVTILWTLLDTQRYKLIAIPAVIYLLFQLVGINREGEMGWYMIPMFPFFSLAIGALAVKHLPKRNLMIVLVILFVGLSYVLNFYEPAFGLTPTVYRIIFALLLGPPLFIYLFGSDQWVGRFNSAWFSLLIFISAIQTYFYIHPE